MLGVLFNRFSWCVMDNAVVKLIEKRITAQAEKITHFKFFQMYFKEKIFCA